MVGLPTIWLTFQLDGRPTIWMVGLLQTGWSAYQLDGWPTNWMVGLQTGLSVYQQVGEPTNWMVGLPTGWSAYQRDCRPTNWMVVLPTGWLILYICWTLVSWTWGKQWRKRSWLWRRILTLFRKNLSLLNVNSLTRFVSSYYWLKKIIYIKNVLKRLKCIPNILIVSGRFRQNFSAECFWKVWHLIRLYFDTFCL